MKRVIETMAKIQSALGGLLLAVCLALIVFQMVSGYIGADASWARRASLCAMIWGVFIESGALVYEKRHFAFTGLNSRIKNPRLAVLWDLGLSLIKILFALLLIFYGVMLAAGADDGKIGFLNFGFLWLCLPVCGATSFIYLAYHLVSDCRRLREGGGGK